MTNLDHQLEWSERCLGAQLRTRLTIAMRTFPEMTLPRMALTKANGAILWWITFFKLDYSEILEL